MIERAAYAMVESRQSSDVLVGDSAVTTALSDRDELCDNSSDRLRGVYLVGTRCTELRLDVSNVTDDPLALLG